MVFTECLPTGRLDGEDHFAAYPGARLAMEIYR
jgi:hypothetical protein